MDKQQIISLIRSHLFQRVASFLLSLIHGCFDRLGIVVLISFREWLHSYQESAAPRNLLELLSSHLFQRVASFLHLVETELMQKMDQLFSSLSESGFIPTPEGKIQFKEHFSKFSSLSESGFIPTHHVTQFIQTRFNSFSSLSESGFIPTEYKKHERFNKGARFSSLSESGFIPTSSHSKGKQEASEEFSSLSESGFIPT